MCVYNAQQVVQKAVLSILENDSDLIREIILIDDHSNFKTKKMLRSMCKLSPKISLFRNKRNVGYTKSANIGLRKVNSEFVVLLNSDVIVTPNWIFPMYNAMILHQDLAICGPLSNSASWQSVPKLMDENGEWKVNEIPDGYSIKSFAELLSNQFRGELISIPFINGFCSLIRVDALKQVGYLDEENFPTGYGEENDLALRLFMNGWKCLVAADSFVYHFKSQSFGNLKRNELSRLGSEVLHELYGRELIRGFTHAKNYYEINSVRERLARHLSRSD